MTSKSRLIPGLRLGSIVLVALSLSIGWGIRGNFGHNYGAMIAGALSAITVCLLSGREDWRRRVPYFGMFGALGWAFGGTISYGQVLAYTESGAYDSQMYGFACLAAIGFLWAALGAAGTAFPAVAEEDRLTGIFRPLAWIFAAWLLLGLIVAPLVEEWVLGFNTTEFRQRSPMYWLDADWLPTITAIIALMLFDLWHRRFEKGLWLLVFASVGAALGALLQWLLQSTGLVPTFLGLVLRYQGGAAGVLRENLMINWPQFFLDVPQHLGWIFGLIVGITLFFALFGRFPLGASLLMHMAAGWFACFLLFPVLLDIHMTPPLADDWAGILGVLLGASLYFLRNGMASIVFVSIVAGIVGGLGFSSMQMLKEVLRSIGNPMITSDPALIAYWKHWQSANWHSFLEQSYGFVNGIGIALAFGFLAPLVPYVVTKDPAEDPDLRKIHPLRWALPYFILFLLMVGGSAGLWHWGIPGSAKVLVAAIVLGYLFILACIMLGKFAGGEIMAASFVLFLVTYINLAKNVPEWTAKFVPKVMKAPLIESVQLSAEAWFTITFAIVTFVCLHLMLIHYRRRRIAMVPVSWLGKGQLFYVVFLWIMILGNLERALPNFTEQRILTEWVFFIGGIVTTAMILLCPRDVEVVIEKPQPQFAWRIAVSLAAGLAILAGAVYGETCAVRLIYDDKPISAGPVQKRFGPDATWRVNPIRTDQEHK